MNVHRDISGWNFYSIWDIEEEKGDKQINIQQRS